MNILEANRGDCELLEDRRCFQRAAGQKNRFAITFEVDKSGLTIYLDDHVAQTTTRHDLDDLAIEDVISFLERASWDVDRALLSIRADNSR